MATESSSDSPATPSNIAILGPGLLGGSIALAVKNLLPGASLKIWARRDQAVEQLIGRGFAPDQVSSHLTETTKGVDLIVLATPVGAMAGLAEQLVRGGAIRSGALVTDAGSVKSPVVAQVAPIIESAGATFVGAHPMAGSDRSGLEFATAELLQQAICFVTPGPATEQSAVRTVAAFWRDLGMIPVLTTPSEHDQTVARISHMPHIAAAAVCLAALGRNPDRGRFCGQGLKDTTRVASGLPVMWTEILLENRQAVMESVRDLQANLADLLALLNEHDHDGLAAFLEQAKQMRDSLA